MDKKLTITASPHVFHKVDTQKMMYGTCLALIPAIIASVIFFGWKAMILILGCVTTCLLSEAVFKKMRGKDVSVDDGGALLTGLLLAMVIPPDLPLWMAILACIFAIGIGKEIFGGLGQNIFNPALLGRAFLSATFPASMTVYSSPLQINVDAVTSATPLGLIKFEGISTNIWNLFIGNIAGSVGETCVIALLIGGLYILIKKYADWRIPMSFIGSVFILGGLLHIISPDKYPSALFHLFSGGLLIGALFMATDPVTSPVTKLGKWLFGIGCGILVVVIRLWGGQPEGVMYAILLMNGLTPVINIVTKPKRYGT